MIERIHSPADLASLTQEEIAALCADARAAILEATAAHGGHLASNLGAVELTVALHRVLRAPHDRILFDVGHQCYTHKMLTGRLGGFSALRETGGLSGFPSREESEYDPFTSGHSGASLSAALGMAASARLDGSDAWTAAVIGDASFGNGMIYEALQNCAQRGLRLLIVLNDNEMSISPNVGAMSEYFSHIRVSRGYFAFKRTVKGICSHIPLLGRAMIRFAVWAKELIKRTMNMKNIFENLGLEYLGPVDGADEAALEAVLREAMECGMPCVVHVLTKKGRGYPPAEEMPERYHSVPPFDAAKGLDGAGKKETFSSVFGEAMLEAAGADERVCAVTAAMRDGTGLGPFAERFPERFFDVGIAEEHAVTFAAGLARDGKRPVAALYSTFAQRTFDQMLHDAALQRLPLVVALDRCGIVPGDGATHQGLFDVGLFSPIPGVEIFAPESHAELRRCLAAALRSEAVSVVRYPRGSETVYDRGVWREQDGLFAADFGTAGERAAIVTYGRVSVEALRAAEQLAAAGRRVRVVRLVRIHPLDADALRSALDGCGSCVFVEEAMRRGGIGEEAAALLPEVRFTILAPAEFLRHGDVTALTAAAGLDAASIAARVRDAETRGEAMGGPF